MHNLVSRFASAGLDLRFASAPFTGGFNTASIFQLDIRRARAHDVRSEHFLAWLGSVQNLASVQAVDPKEKQVVLAVREAAQEFEEPVPRWIVKSTREPAGSLAWKESIARRANVPADLVVARTGGASIVRFTESRTRHMLVGRDERQLFMCQLPRPCTSIKQAHDALRSPAARSRSRSALERPARQGEWFFLLPTATELAALEADLTSNATFIRDKRSINAFIPRTGKAHLADELVFCRRQPEPLVFVRGGIRHPDHKTIYFHQWRRVVQNQEIDQGRSPFGGTWMD